MDNFMHKIIFCILFFSLNVKAEIPVGEIENLASVLKAEYENLSPIWGAIFWKTNYVENIYRFASGSSTKKLVQQDLFFLQFDGVTFDATNHPLLPAYYFDASIIGKLILAFVEYRNDLNELEVKKESEEYKNLTKKRDSLLNKLKYSRGDEKSDIAGQLKIIKEQLAQLSNKLVNNKFKQKITQIINEINFNSQKVEDFYKQIINRLSTVSQKDLIEIKEKQEFITDTNKQKKLYEINKRNLVEHLFFSITNDEGNLFPVNNTIWILLSFLWVRSDKKIEFWNYFKELSKGSFDFFNNVDFLEKSESKELFLQSTFTREDYNNFYNGKFRVKENLQEQLVFLFLGFDVYKNMLPPEIYFKSGVRYKNASYSDCGGTSLLNFFNLLLYDSDKKLFDTSVINNLDPSEKLIIFYKKYKAPDEMPDTLELHNDWAQVVSGLKGDLYRDDGCNIKGGINNKGINRISLIIQQLLPGLKMVVGGSVFEKLSNFLKTKGIMFVVKQKNEDAFQELSIFLKKEYMESPFRANWFFEFNHYVFEFPLAENVRFLSQDSNADIKSEWKKEKKTKYNIIKHLILSKCLDLEFMSFYFSPIYNPIYNKYKILFRFFKPINDRDAVQIIKDIVVENDLKDLKIGFILNLYKFLPDDYHTQKEVLRFLAKIPFKRYQDLMPMWGIYTKMSEFISSPSLFKEHEKWLFNNFKNLVYQGNQARLLEKMLYINPKIFIGERETLEHFYDFIVKNLENIKEQKNKIYLMNKIFELNLEDFVENEYLLVPVYSWVMKNLISINDEKIQRSFIQSISNLDFKKLQGRLRRRSGKRKRQEIDFSTQDEASSSNEKENVEPQIIKKRKIEELIAQEYPLKKGYDDVPMSTAGVGAKQKIKEYFVDFFDWAASKTNNDAGKKFFNGKIAALR